MRAGIQNELIFCQFAGFQVSLNIILLVRNDSFAELRHRLAEERKRTGLFPCIAAKASCLIDLLVF
jgi:hypothetical protein